MLEIAMQMPFDLKFDSVGNMFIVDYCVVEINIQKARPYVYKANRCSIKTNKRKVNI
jgi:hypothetical protein